MAQLPSFIFGMHDPGGESLFLNAGKPGWTTVSIQVNPPDSNGDFSALANQGFGMIARLNNGYGSAGTLPVSAQYDAFAQQCASFVAASKGAKIWIIGNETNLAAERPGNSGGNDGEVITPDKYAQCFAKCRSAIKKLAGHTDDWVVPAPPAPWNNQTTYAGNPNGDWVVYFKDILTQCVALNAVPDALALHTYTHGLDPSLITSEQKMDAPFANYHSQFRAYRDFIGAIPTALRLRAIFITETQAADPTWWQNRNVGWIQAAYKEINDWNSVSTNQNVQGLCLFRWQTGNAQWSISDKPALLDDFRAALQNAYRAYFQQPQPVPPPVDPAGQAAIAAALKLTWMPINTNAALYRFAQSQNLGYPQTDEFQLTFSGDTYIAQVFNLGIVYVKSGDWGNVQWMKKPAGM